MLTGTGTAFAPPLVKCFFSGLLRFVQTDFRFEKPDPGRRQGRCVGPVALRAAPGGCMRKGRYKRSGTER